MQTPINSCSARSCSAGDKGITFASKEQPYFACPTRELSEYTNFVSGLIFGSLIFTGKIPNISDKTGEPEYPDEEDGTPNETRLLLDLLRNEAHVETYDEAANLCYNGINGQKVIILNSPKDKESMWVMSEKNKKTFWMLGSSIDKR